MYILLTLLSLFIGRIAYAAEQLEPALTTQAVDTLDTTAMIVVPPSLYLDYPLLSNPAYDFLDRTETATLAPVLSGIRPFIAFKRRFWTVGSAEESLASTDVTPQHRESKEWQRYDYEGIQRGWLQNEGSIMVDAAVGWWGVHKQFDSWKATNWIYADGRHLASFETGNRFAATLQPIYGFEMISTDDERETISRFSGGFRVEGSYAPSLHMMIDFRDHTESGNGPYFSRAQLYDDRWAAVDLKGKSSTSYDISESLIQYNGPDLALAAGRGRHRWGPAHFGGLFLNDYAPPFDYVRFDGVLESKRNSRALYYTFLHGFLASNIPAYVLYEIPDLRLRTIDAQKYISAQRIEFRAHRNVLLGFSQGVIYGDRGVQLGYLTPFNFLYSVQHSNNDKDNLLWGLDAKWRVVRGLKIYAELLLDDVVVGDLTQSTGNNKSAYTLGIHMIHPSGVWEHFDARVEYTRIRPFVYSHFFDVNTYSHWTSPLGYSREPNSEYLSGELRGTFYPVQAALTVMHQNHGENTPDQNVGGDINVPVTESNNETYPFLDGYLVRTTRIGVRVKYELLPGLLLFASAESIARTDVSDRMETTAGFSWNF